METILIDADLNAFFVNDYDSINHIDENCFNNNILAIPIRATLKELERTLGESYCTCEEENKDTCRMNHRMWFISYIKSDLHSLIFHDIKKQRTYIMSSSNFLIINFLKFLYWREKSI